MYAATKKVIMFVHLWKIFCEERSVFSILRGKKRGKFSHFYLFFFFLNQTAGKQRGKAQESSGKIHCHQGSLCSSRNLWIEPLNSLSTMCVLKKQDTKRRRWFGSCGSPLPNGRKEMFGRNPKTEKKQKKQRDKKDKWMDCFSDTNRQIWERKRPCVVTVGLIMWRPLGRPVGSGHAGWLVVIARSRLIGQWSTTQPHPSVRKLISR